MRHVRTAYLSRALVATSAQQSQKSFATQCSLSDHTYIFIDIVAATPPNSTHTLPSGLPRRQPRCSIRLRSDFIKDPPLLAAYKQHIRTLLQTAPPTDLVDWWPQAKREIVSIVRRLHQKYKIQCDNEHITASAALVELLPAAETGDLEAISRVAATKKQMIDTIHQQRLIKQLKSRHDWISQMETPSPLLSQRLMPPKQAQIISALQDSGGVLRSSPHAMANIMATHCAHICTHLEPNLASQQEVLASLSLGPSLEQETATATGSTTITTSEVHEALKQSKIRAPGPDGIPIWVYRAAKELFAPLLAKLFTSIGEIGRLPDNFNHGIIHAFYKGQGASSAPANYRPITLLGTDYRLLAKVLATRFGAALPTIINPIQAAYLPGRHIADNASLHQMLPPLLTKHKKYGFAAQCDFQKAYETVQRDFLYQVMQHLGCSVGMLHWTKLLLSHTTASALINGVQSRKKLFHAGTRQGDRLAPYLYIFIGEAMLRYLQSNNIGITASPTQVHLPPLLSPDNADTTCLTPGTALSHFWPSFSVDNQGEFILDKQHTAPTYGQWTASNPLQITGTQYADDTTLFIISNLDELGPLKSLLDKFGQASGQLPNWQKMLLLPIGAVPPRDTKPGQPLAAGTMHHGFKVVHKLTTLGITLAMGTQQATVPWANLIEKVDKRLDKITHVGLSKFGRATAASAYGTSQLLYHAELAGLPPSILLQQLQTTLANTVFRDQRPHSQQPNRPPHHQSYHGMARRFMGIKPADGGFGGIQVKPHVFSRHAKHLIDMIVSGTSKPWTLIAWTLLFAQLSTTQWTNYWITHMEQAAQQSVVYTLPHDSFMKATTFKSMPPALKRLFNGAHAIPMLHLDGQASISITSLALLRLHPTANLATRFYGTKAPVWKQGHKEYNLHTYSVSLGTWLQLQPERDKLQLRHADYLRKGPALPRAAMHPNLAELSPQQYIRQRLQRLHRLKWAPSYKETLWQILSNSLPTALRRRSHEYCACGHIPAQGQFHDLNHYFYDCPIATSLVNRIATVIGLPQDTTAAHLWWLSPPSHITDDAWLIICLAAYTSVRRGWIQMSEALAQSLTLQGPQTAAARMPPEGTYQRQGATTTLQEFLEALADFCSTNDTPPTHPPLQANPLLGQLLFFDTESNRWIVNAAAATPTAREVIQHRT
jgi:hypothetical protein